MVRNDVRHITSVCLVCCTCTIHFGKAPQPGRSAQLQLQLTTSTWPRKYDFFFMNYTL